jgi:hypothetical protein
MLQRMFCAGRSASRGSQRYSTKWCIFIARRVFIGYMVVSMDHVHVGVSGQITDFPTGSHATLQRYSAPHCTFSVCRQPYFSTCEATIQGATSLVAYSKGYVFHSNCFACDFDKSYLLSPQADMATTIATPTSLSIFFQDPYSEYLYSDAGSRVAGYISFMDVFPFRPSNSLFQIARGLGGYTQ